MFSAADVLQGRARRHPHRLPATARGGVALLGLDLLRPLLADRVDRLEDVVASHDASTVDFPRSAYCTRGCATCTSSATGWSCAEATVAHQRVKAPSVFAERAERIDPRCRPVHARYQRALLVLVFERGERDLGYLRQPVIAEPTRPSCSRTSPRGSRLTRTASGGARGRARRAASEGPAWSAPSSPRAAVRPARDRSRRRGADPTAGRGRVRARLGPPSA